MICYMNCHTSKDSEHADYCLQPVAKEISSYIEDKTDFLRKITNWLCSRQLILVSGDVKSLYTNIANAEGINYVKTSLGSYSKRSTSIKVINKFLVFIVFSITKITQI